MGSREKSQSEPQAIDLEIRITTPWGHGRASLQFVLSSPSGAIDFYQESISGKPIHRPESFQQHLFQQLEKLQKGVYARSGRSKSGALQELSAIGHDLYHELLPREMRVIYRAFRDKVKTLLIVSDEPWVPWEILRPSEYEDDDFLCMQFEMSRWLAGESVLKPMKGVRRLLGINAKSASSGKRLPGGEPEMELLAGLVGQIAELEGCFPRHVRHDDLIRLLETESFDLIHLVGHGRHAPEMPGEARVALEDLPLLARHLSPAAETRLRAAQPVVFFNSCQVARLDRSLTELDGWASRWVKRCGCSAFLAPFWAVDDQRALQFARSFYGEIANGTSLGRAVQAARVVLRDEDPDELTWLAYSLYGHPSARITFGTDDEPGTRPRGGAKAHTSAAVASVEPRRPSAWSPAPSENGPVKSPSRRQVIVAAGTLVLSMALLLFLIRSLEPVMEESADELGSSISVDSGKQNDSSETELSAAEGSHLPGAQSGASGSTESLPAGVGPTLDAQRPRSAVPMAPVEAGKVGILILDHGTREADVEVARLVRKYISSASSGLAPVVLTAELGFTESLLDGDISALLKDGRTPWGAEYVLAATVSSKEIPHQFEALSVSFSGQLFAARDASTILELAETHTGLGTTREAALDQAVGRCVVEVVEALQRKGGAP